MLNEIFGRNLTKLAENLGTRAENFHFDKMILEDLDPKFFNFGSFFRVHHFEHNVRQFFGHLFYRSRAVYATPDLKWHLSTFAYLLHHTAS